MGLGGTHLTPISHLTLIRFRAWGVPIARNPHLTTIEKMRVYDFANCGEVLAAPWEAVHREAVPREAVGPAAAEPLPPVRFLQVCIGFAAFFQTYMIHALLHFSILEFP